MKKSIYIIALMLLCNTSVIAAEAVYKIGVDGLACPFCVYGIEKQLDKLDGIERMETDLQDGKIVLEMGEGATLNEESVRDAVTRAGFTLRSFMQSQ
jgi:periplasmic mercuric ion binding protein